MTREEAIEILTDHWTTIDNSRYSSDELNEAFNIAIRALKNEQTDGDLISRQAVLEVYDEWRYGKGITYTNGLQRLREQFEKLPSAEKTAKAENL